MSLFLRDTEATLVDVHMYSVMSLFKGRLSYRCAPFAISAFRRRGSSRRKAD